MVHVDIAIKMFSSLEGGVRTGSQKFVEKGAEPVGEYGSRVYIRKLHRYRVIPIKKTLL